MADASPSNKNQNAYYYTISIWHKTKCCWKYHKCKASGEHADARRSKSTFNSQSQETSPASNYFGRVSLGLHFKKFMCLKETCITACHKLIFLGVRKITNELFLLFESRP